MTSLHVIDVTALTDPAGRPASRSTVARALDAAARTHGFFYVTEACTWAANSGPNTRACVPA